MVDHFNKGEADTASITYCKALPKIRFRVNLDDKGSTKWSDILEVLPKFKC